MADAKMDNAVLEDCRIIFRNFAGKPLFRWILETLLELPEIEKIVINTDAHSPDGLDVL